MSTTQLCGLIGRSHNRHAGQRPIGPATTGHLRLDAQESEVPTGEVRSNLRQVAALDGSQPVLLDAGGDGPVANPSGAANFLAAGAERVPTVAVFAVGERVAGQARKRVDAHSSQAHGAQPDVVRVENGGAIAGQHPFQPNERSRRLHAIVRDSW